MDFIHSKRWDVVSRFLEEVGKPVEMQIYRAWFLLHDPGKFTHVMTYATVLLTAFVTFRLLRDSKFFNSESSALIGALSITFPIVKANSDSVILVYLLNYLSFLCGMWTAYFSVTAENLRRRWAFRVASYFFLAFGFLMNSTLIYFFCLLLFFFVRQNAQGKIPYREQLAHLSKAAFRFFKQNADLCLFPFFFWILKKIFTAPTGAYANYNQIVFDWSLLKLGYYHLVKTTIGGALWDLVQLPATVILFVGLIAILRPVWSDYRKRAGDALPSYSGMQISSAMLLVFVGTFPYILVGQYAFNHFGWATKNNILLQLPLAILIERILAGLKYFGLRGLQLREVITVAFLLFCGIATVKNYIRWEATSAIEHSVALQVAEFSKTQPISIVHVIRNYNIPQTFEGSPAPIVLSAMMRLEDKKLPVFCTNEPPKDGRRYQPAEIIDHINNTTVPYAFNEIDQSGNQVRISVTAIDAGRSATNIAIGFLKSRAQSAEARESFLRQLSTISVEHLTGY